MLSMNVQPNVMVWVSAYWILSYSNFSNTPEARFIHWDFTNRLTALTVSRFVLAENKRRMRDLFNSAHFNLFNCEAITVYRFDSKDSVARKKRDLFLLIAHLSIRFLK